MPRGARLDSPGTLHHVIVRGIERRNIVDDDLDRENWVIVTSCSAANCPPHRSEATLVFGMAGRVFFKLSIEERIPLLQKAYYLRKIADLEARRRSLEASLAGFRFDRRMERLGMSNWRQIFFSITSEIP